MQLNNGTLICTVLNRYLIITDSLHTYTITKIKPANKNPGAIWESVCKITPKSWSLKTAQMVKPSKATKNRALNKFLLVFFDNLNNILFRIGYQSCVFLLFFQNVCVNDPVLQYCFKCVVCWSIYSLFCAFFMHKIFL